jgi:1,4-dihydroxy-2-naphthoyl-CoA hydrolase
VSDRSATEVIHAAMPFCATLGVHADHYAAEEVALSLDWAPERCTTGGIMHGGVIMALADSAGGACAFLNLPQDATGTATIESKTNFLGVVRSGKVKATATPLHAGGTTIVVETAVHDGTGRMVAKVTQTQMVLRPRL